MREPERRSVGLVLEAGGCRHRAQHGRIMTRAKRKAFVDDDGGNVGIEHRRTERVLKAPDYDRLINESVEGTAQPPPFGCEILPMGGGNAGHDQRLEIGSARLVVAERCRQQVWDTAVALVVYT